MIKSGDQVILIGGENKINGQQIKNIEARDQRIGKKSWTCKRVDLL